MATLLRVLMRGPLGTLWYRPPGYPLAAVAVETAWLWLHIPPMGGLRLHVECASARESREQQRGSSCTWCVGLAEAGRICSGGSAPGTAAARRTPSDPLAKKEALECPHAGGHCLCPECRPSRPGGVEEGPSAASLSTEQGPWMCSGTFLSLSFLFGEMLQGLRRWIRRACPHGLLLSLPSRGPLLPPHAPPPAPLLPVP